MVCTLSIMQWEYVLRDYKIKELSTWKLTKIKYVNISWRYVKMQIYIKITARYFYGLIIIISNIGNLFLPICLRISKIYKKFRSQYPSFGTNKRAKKSVRQKGFLWKNPAGDLKFFKTCCNPFIKSGGMKNIFRFFKSKTSDVISYFLTP